MVPHLPQSRGNGLWWTESSSLWRLLIAFDYTSCRGIDHHLTWERENKDNKTQTSTKYTGLATNHGAGTKHCPPLKRHLLVTHQASLGFCNGEKFQVQEKELMTVPQAHNPPNSPNTGTSALNTGCLSDDTQWKQSCLYLWGEVEIKMEGPMYRLKPAYTEIFKEGVMLEKLQSSLPRSPCTRKRTNKTRCQLTWLAPCAPCWQPLLLTQLVVRSRDAMTVGGKLAGWLGNCFQP